MNLASGPEQRSLDVARREFGIQGAREARNPRCERRQQNSRPAIPVRHAQSVIRYSAPGRMDLTPRLLTGG